MKRSFIKYILAVLGMMIFSAGAVFAANAMYVAPSGKVGIGTSSPTEKLDVVGIIKSSGSANSLMFQDRNTAANAWEWYSAGNKAGLYKGFLGSGTVMTIDGANGNVGIGTTSPSARLTLQEGCQQINTFTASGNEYVDWPYAALSIRRIDDYGQMKMIQLGHRDDNPYQTGNNVWHFSLVDSTGYKTTSDSDTRLFIGGPGNCVIWPNGNVGINKWNPSYALDVNGVICGNNVSPSDERLKKNVKSLPNCLEKVTKLRGVSYEWKDQAKGKGKQIGVIAQEVEKEYPEVVLTDKDGYKSVAYDKLVGVLIEAVKAQQKEIDELKKQINKK